MLFQPLAAGELGAVVKGDGLPKRFWNELEDGVKLACNEVRGFVVRPCGEKNARASLVHSEDELAVLCEADQIGFPVSGSTGNGFAMRAALEAGTTNPVSLMPRGTNSLSSKNSPSRFLITASTAALGAADSTSLTA